MWSCFIEIVRVVSEKKLKVFVDSNEEVNTHARRRVGETLQEGTDDVIVITKARQEKYNFRKGKSK